MIQLNVNNQMMAVDVDAATPLIWVLRDHLKLVGTKFGCGMGVCGACTILMDGEPARSCLVPAEAAVGKKIVTIEGLSEHGDHPLQKAWKELNVPQCGYCQPGQIMNAAALHDKNPRPSSEDIRQHMQGNICRCGTYPRIEAAIKKAGASGEA
jgi:aerobic-type carbon monoxide dehydrogenase small subunit (CoxS/CutS family)